MSTPALSEFLDHLSKSMQTTSIREVSDGQLLQQVATSRDQNAFRVLVERHGSMVYGVCRRYLRQEQDVEDAFQAAFFVLARKASSIVTGNALVGWLYKVACRVARQASQNARRHAHQTLLDHDDGADDALSKHAQADQHRVIVDEIDRLPEKYRMVTVLCCLQGDTHEAAAKRLRCPTSTVSVRLMRAKQILRDRLERRGVALSASGLVVLLSTQSSFAVSSLLQSSTTTAALEFAVATHASADAGSSAALAKGVLQMMVWSQIKRIALSSAIVLTIAVALGIAALPLRSEPTSERRRAAAVEQPNKNKPQQPKNSAKASARAVGLAFVHALFGEENFKKAAALADKKGKRQAAVKDRPLRQWILQLKPGELDRVQLKAVVFFDKKEFAAVKAQYAGPRPDSLWDRIPAKLKDTLGCLVDVRESEQHGSDRHLMILFIRPVDGENRIVYIDDD